jgi:hypothetical protein
MGYGGTALLRLAELRKAGVLTKIKRVMDVGAQLTSATANYVRPFVEAFGSRKPTDRDIDNLVAKAYSRYLWEYCDIEYKCIDLGANLDCIFLDLNFDQLPAKLANYFDLVTNCGTTEHVVNQVNSFKLIHEMTRPGGFMFHDVPWTGMNMHGFFNYKPSLFYNMAVRNNYRWVGMWLRKQGSTQQIPVELPLHDFPNQFEMDDGMILIVYQKTEDKPFALPLEVDGPLPKAFASRY